MANLSSHEVRTRVERWNVAASITAGMLISAYYDAAAKLPPHTSLAAFWVTSLLSSAALAGLFVYAALRFTRRRFEHHLDWIDEGRSPTEVEARDITQAPLAVAIVVLGFWLLAGLAIALGPVLFNGTSMDSFKAYVGTALGGLFAAGLSYFLTERAFRPVIALVLEGQPSPSPRRWVLGVRGRLLMAWLLGSGIPLVGIALTPFLRHPDAPLPLAAPMVILAVVGAAGGIAMTSAASRSIAEPLDEFRTEMRRVAGGELDGSLSVDDAGEVGLLQAGFNSMVAGLRQRQELADLFGRYVGEDVARLAVDQGTALVGEVRTVSVFFVDLVGSTVMARQTPPEKVVARLNQFFSAVVDAVTAEGGWVNKFEGDGALCVFGAPAEQPDHAVRALRAAAALHGVLEAGGIDAGIGVASGDVVAGNVGTERRFEYTVIGHPVNEASRLTEAAKRHTPPVLSSVAGPGWESVGVEDLRGVGAVEVYAPATGSPAWPAPARSPRTGP